MLARLVLRGRGAGGSIRRRCAETDDRGSMTAFVVVMVAAMIVCAGLVFDGGRLVAARVDAADQAENAARVGAQQTRVLRGGGVELDVPAARAAAADYLAAVGADGTVAVSGTSVFVTVSRVQPMKMLAVVGVGPKTVVATRSVEAVTE